jgi:hypothetical protein
MNTNGGKIRNSLMAAGQSPEKQQQDQYNCDNWSTQQSGYDPNNPPAQSSGPSFGSASKETLRGGARGEAAGAAIGAIAGGMKRGFQERDNQKQAASAPPPGLDNYNRAIKSCLGAMGYSVN